MAVRKESIGVQIQRIRTVKRKRDDATGMLYNRRDELTRLYKKVTLWALFVSDENTFLLRPHIFEAKQGRTAEEWSAWFTDHYGEILRESILPGMGNRTDKIWRLYRIIGWAANDNRRLVHPKTHKARHKAKRQRR